MPVLIAADASTSMETVALVRDGEVLAERTTLRPRGAGTSILNVIDGLLVDSGLSLSAVDGFVCGLGPGSFTGLRIAVSTLKGLAFATGRPIYGVRTAVAFAHAHPGQSVLVAIDAKRGEIFVDGTDLAAPVCCRPTALAELLPERVSRIAFGDGARFHAAVLASTLPGLSVPEARALHFPRAAFLTVGLDLTLPADVSRLEPEYARRSDAELNYPDGFRDGRAVPRQKLPKG